MSESAAVLIVCLWKVCGEREWIVCVHAGFGSMSVFMSLHECFCACASCVCMCIYVCVCVCVVCVHVCVCVRTVFNHKDWLLATGYIRIHEYTTGHMEKLQ